MPIEEAQSQIRARVTNPDDFIPDSLRTKVIDENQGISIIIGKLKNSPDGGMATQAYRFEINKNWDVNKASAWLKEHGIKTMSNDFPALTFANLDNVEIFATGTWHNKPFTESDLDKIVQSFKCLGDKLKPYLKLGHDDNQALLQKDGYPSAGWITDLKRKGDKLVASFRDVPKVIADLIEKRAYKRISSELYMDYEAGSNKFPLVLKAVALLGGDTPEVTSLSDVVALYNHSNLKATAYTFTTEELLEEKKEIKKESEAKKMTELELKIALSKREEELRLEFASKEQSLKAELEAKIAEELEQYKSKVDTATEVLSQFGKAEDLKSFINELQKEKAQITEKEREYNQVLLNAKKAEVEHFCDQMISENKVLPAQKEMLSKLLLTADSSPELLEFSKTDAFGLKEKMKMKDVLMCFVSSYPDLGLLKQFTSSARGGSKSVDEERAELVSEYSKKFKVSYRDAQIEIAKTRPDLFRSDEE